jgi:hypothetical protein
MRRSDVRCLTEVDVLDETEVNTALASESTSSTAAGEFEDATHDVMHISPVRSKGYAGQWRMKKLFAVHVLAKLY